MKYLLLFLSLFIILGFDLSSDLDIQQKIQFSPEDKLEKIEYYSSIFKGTEYSKNPLGEGSSGTYDKDPLYRFDKFDCLTFVETVLALSISENFQEFEQNIDRVRYKNGNISFLSRNHFVTLDWIPNNSEFLKDVTNEVGTPSVFVLKNIIDKQSWFEKNYNIKTDHEPEISAIRYIPKGVIDISKIPSGSIISIVRPNVSTRKKIGTDISVFHIGFAIRKNGKLFFYHASSEKEKVVEEDFVEYFSKYDRSDGINILTLIQDKQ